MTEKEYISDTEKINRDELTNLLKTCPIPEDQLLANMGIFLTSKNLSRILFMNDIYQKVVEVPGIVMEFGTRWGQNTTIFSTLRGIYDPFNRHRKVVCFDTFTGFPNVTVEDGTSELMKVGSVSTTQNYEEYLAKVLSCHEKLNPIEHLKKFEIVKGDVMETLPKYLKEYPETIISLAYFDMDLYQPTKSCLRSIRERMPKGSIVAFDELSDKDSPGETLALMDTHGVFNVTLRRPRYTSRVSYFVVE